MSSSKAGSSSEIDAEIARLMRTPGALRAETEQMRRSSGRGHYDPNQPRVPAGDPRGGQFASKGYRGGDSEREHVTQGLADGTQLAQLGQGNPRDAYAQVRSFDGQFGDISAAQHLASQNGFIRARNSPGRDRAFETEDGRYKFVSTGPVPSPERTPAGTRWVVSSTTYAYDDATGAYATISATPARPMFITSSYGKLFIRPFSREFDRR